jgi:hypothetical protein
VAELSAHEARVEIGAVEVVGDTRAEQVAKLRPVAQVVDGDDVVDAIMPAAPVTTTFMRTTRRR